MEPRAYSAAPIGTNFLVAGYLRTTGGASLDPSLPITNVQATVNTASLGYERTFGLFGQTARLALVVPYFDAGLSGAVHEASKEISREGIGDIRLRFAANLIGGAALSPAEFIKRTPSTALGVSLTAVAPTGDYNPSHLVNIGSHRWAFRPEIGLSQPLGDWFADLALGGWFFTDNGDFLLRKRRGQEPITNIQAHAGYNFRPGLWLAADATHYFGGDTVIDGVNKHNFQSVTRCGVTLSVPLAQGWQAKFAWSTWLTSKNGGGYDSISLAVQYRWFD